MRPAWGEKTWARAAYEAAGKARSTFGHNPPIAVPQCLTLPT